MFFEYSALITLVALTAILAYSFYAVLLAGQLSLAQIGLASLAAFTSSLVVPEEPLFGIIPPLLVGVVFGMAVGMIAAFILGLPVVRLRGVFLAIATLAFAEMVRIFLINQTWTNGAQGMSFPKLVGPLEAWILLILVAFWFWRLSGSRLGRTFDAIREDETAALSMGINVAKYRMASFVIAGAVSGLYGVLLAYFSRFADPNEFSFTAAVDGLVTAVVGGVSMFIGPVLGGTFLTVLPELQRMLGIDAGWIRPLLSGVILLLVILFLPGGLSALIPRRRRRSVLVDDEFDAVEALPDSGTVVASLNGIGKAYGGVRAVDSVSAEIKTGQVFGLMGPNGAGKTTLVNMLTGMTPPTSGSGEILGVHLGGRTRAHHLGGVGVARTFQQIKVFSRLTVLENVLVGAFRVTRPTLWRRMLFLPSARRDERQAVANASAQLRRVGLADKAQLSAGNLSYGDQRRLEIARALAAQPTLLMLDEPAAGMNHVEAAELSVLIRALAADGIAVVLIEHNVRMMMKTCDEILVLNFGKVIASGQPEKIARDEAVIAAYLGDSERQSSEDAASFTETALAEEPHDESEDRVRPEAEETGPTHD